MSSTASNLYFASPHPWSGAIRSFSNISFLAFVIQIDDENQIMTKLKIASSRERDSTQQMTIAGLVHDICANMALIDATPSFLYSIDKKTLHAATNFFRREVADLSVKRGLEFLKEIISGSSYEHMVMPGPVRLPRLKLTVHSRRSENNVLQILLSAQWDSDSLVNRSEERALISVVDSTADFVLAMNLGGKIDFMNRGMLELFGKDFRVGESELSDFVSPDTAERFTQITTIVMHENEAWSGVLEFVHPLTSDVMAVTCHVTLLRDPLDQKITGYCITGYRNIESNPLSGVGMTSKAKGDEVSRLEMVGKIASHAIQEVKEPLEVIKSKADKVKWLLRVGTDQSLPLKKEAAVDDHLGKILAMADRITRVVEGMNNLSNHNAIENKTDVNLNELVEEVYELVASAAKKTGVHIEVTKPSEQISVRIQRLRFSQVLVNLMLNGCEAISHSPEKWVKLNVVTDSEWIYILVSDSGPALTPALKMRLFEPFFTTKKRDQIKTIGLNLSRKIAREHGGDLYLDESSPHTRLVLELPLFERDGAVKTEEDWEEI